MAKFFSLVLSNAYEPISSIPWRQSIILWYNKKIEILATYNKQVRSPSITINIPSVVKIKKSVNFRFYKDFNPSKQNIYLRDNYQCGYCEKIVKYNDKTIDHVISLSHGGKSTWGNMVTCCYKCNQIKGDRPLAECGLILHHKLFKPNPYHLLLSKGYNKSWLPYLEPFINTEHFKRLNKNGNKASNSNS